MDADGVTGWNGTYSGTDYPVKMDQYSAAALQIPVPNDDIKCDVKIGQEQQEWEKAAIILAIVSVLSLIVFGSVSFYLSDLINSAAAFGFGFDCFLDVGTSLVVIWRFCGTTSHSNRKEKIALTVLGCLFIIAALTVSGKAIHYLTDGTLMETSTAIYVLAVCATIISLSLCISKFYVAYKLDSKSVRADGYSSLACGVTAFTIIISSVAYSIDEDVYYLDDIIGIVLSVLLLIFGIKLLVDVCKASTEASEQQTNIIISGKRGYESMYNQ